MVIPTKTREINGRRVYIGYANPKGRPDSEITTYFKESELKRLQTDLIGKPLYIGHVTKAPEGVPGVAPGTPYAPSGTVIGAMVHPRNGRLVTMFMTHKTPNGDLAEKFLQAEKADERMTMLSLGYDVNLVNGLPVGNDVTELSITYQGAHMDTDILTDEEIGKFISNSTVQATASFVIGKNDDYIKEDKKFIIVDIRKLKREREEEEKQETTKRARMDESNQSYFKNFNERFPKRDGYNYGDDATFAARKVKINTSNILGKPGTDHFRRYYGVSDSMINKVLTPPSTKVASTASAAAPVAPQEKKLSDEDKKQIEEDEAALEVLSQQQAELQARLTRLRQLEKDVADKKIALDLNKPEFDIPVANIEEPGNNAVIDASAPPEVQERLKRALIAEQKLYEMEKRNAEVARQNEINRRATLQAMVTKVLPQLLANETNPNEYVGRLEREVAAVAERPEQLYQAFENNLKVTASLDDTCATKVEERMQKLIKARNSLRRNIDKTLESVKPDAQDLMKQTSAYVDESAKKWREVTETAQAPLKTLDFDDLPPLHKAVITASVAKGAPRGVKEPEDMPVKRALFWEKIMEEAGVVDASVKLDYLYPDAKPGQARFDVNRLPPSLHATASYQIEERLNNGMVM